MEKIKKGWIFLLLVFFLTLMSPSSNAVYAGDFNSLMNNTSTYGLIERPEDFLKDKEKAKEWEKKESIRIEKELKNSQKEALETYKRDTIEVTKYSQTRNYFYDYQIESNSREKEDQKVKMKFL